MTSNSNLLSPQFWLDLVPDLSLEDDDPVSTNIDFDDAAFRSISDHLDGDGYINLAPVFLESDLLPIKDAIVTLEKAGLPPVFIYIYDQPWHLFIRLSPLIAHFLGNDFRLLPNLWAWNIGLTKGAHGWPPHHDCQAATRFDDGTGGKILMSLSLWVPLSEATVDNGCMNVIPRQFECFYEEVPDDPDSISPEHARALPACAGSVLGWPQDLVHWGGGVTDQATESRLSLSLEFQNPAFAPLSEPLLDISSPPPFADRLDLVLAQLEKYQHMETVAFDPQVCCSKFS